MCAGVSILSVMSLSSAANPLYIKPSSRGNDMKQTPRIHEAMVFCTDKKFTLVLENGIGYCKYKQATERSAPIKCVNNMTLYTTAQLPAPVRAKYGMADMCLKAGANADDPKSYLPPTCGTDSSGSGFYVTAKPDADVCEKVTYHDDLMTPGNPNLSNQHYLPADLIQRVAVRCPATSYMEMENNALICRVGVKVPPQMPRPRK